MGVAEAVTILARTFVGDLSLCFGHTIFLIRGFRRAASRPAQPSKEPIAAFDAPECNLLVFWQDWGGVIG